MKYIKLMRCKHYIKNLLIFLPIFFSKNVFDLSLFLTAFWGLLSFSLTTSIVYIFNDIMDEAKDKKHPVKCNRPIASGEVKKKNAYILILLLFIIIISINIFILKCNITAYCLLVIYLLINILYSIKLKEVPIVDVTILASGFLIRLLYGATITEIAVSYLLYLTILAISFYMGLGKRKNELIKLEDKSRQVLGEYSKDFLDRNMYVFLTLAIVFYSMWCMEIGDIMNSIINVIWTVPLAIVIMMRYSLNIDKDSYGDPVDVITGDKVLIVLALAFVLLLLLIIYL